MEMRQLKYFTAVAEHLNFTEAARHLYVAQSAVSQQIAELEKELGVKLFQRNKRSVKLTNAGQVLLKETRFLMTRLDEAAKKTRQADLGLIGSLRIGFLGYTERLFLPPVIRRFRKLYPQIDLHLDQYHHGELVELLHSEDLDIGFTLAFGVESVSSLISRKVYQETIAIVMHEDHPQAGNEKVELAELAGEPFIALNRRESPQGYQQTLQICSNHGFTPNIAREPRLMQTVLMLVDAGMGIAILPQGAQLLSPASVHFIPLNEKQNAYELVATWKKNVTNPSIDLFLEELDKLDK